MTRFSLPFTLKTAFSETTVLTVDTDGTLRSTVDIETDAGVKADGPIQSGSAASRGFAVLTQITTVTDANGTQTTVASLPPGAHVQDAYFYVQTAFGTAGADVVLRLGDVDNETKYGAISMDTNIATGMHHLANGAFTSAGTSWLSVSGSARHIMAMVTAVSGAAASGGQGVVFVNYVHQV